MNYIPKILWLWIPLVFVIAQAILEVILPRALMVASVSENGPHELLQFFIILAAALVALKYFISKKPHKHIIYKMWFGLALICCVYVAGEEVSWGQHFFGWATSDNWQAVNDQQETNLHNTSSWFDQKPRLILMGNIIFGTLIAPLLISKNLLKLPDRLKELIPTKELSFMAYLIIVTHLVDKLLETLNISFFARYSEVQEILLFYFVLLYLVNLYHRLVFLEKS